MSGGCATGGQAMGHGAGRLPAAPPSPLVGEGWGGGAEPPARTRRDLTSAPPTPTPPHKGEGRQGGDRECRAESPSIGREG